MKHYIDVELLREQLREAEDKDMSDGLVNLLDTIAHFVDKDGTVTFERSET